MANKFNRASRDRLATLLKQYGFAVELKPDGSDVYDKNLKARALRLHSPVYVNKTTARDDGTPRYFKIAFHPDEFDPAWAEPATGIEEDFNARQNGANRHSSSNYRGYPYQPGNNEPVGACLRVANWQALERLLARISGKTAPASTAVPPVGVSSPVQSATAPPAITPSRPQPASVTDRRMPSADDCCLRGLVIREPWISAILAGCKTWEMRTESTTVRGPIALIAKGTGLIVGIAELVDVIPNLSESDMLDSIDRHGISREQLLSGETASWRTAWVLHGACRLSEPVPYTHPSGAVIWVRLDAATAARIRACR